MAVVSETQSNQGMRKPWTTPAVILADVGVTAGPIDGEPESPDDSQGTS